LIRSILMARIYFDRLINSLNRKKNDPDKSEFSSAFFRISFDQLFFFSFCILVRNSLVMKVTWYGFSQFDFLIVKIMTDFYSSLNLNNGQVITFLLQFFNTLLYCILSLVNSDNGQFFLNLIFFSFVIFGLIVWLLLLGAWNFRRFLQNLLLLGALSVTPCS
jgi:hypothetical protein